MSLTSTLFKKPKKVKSGPALDPTPLLMGSLGEMEVQVLSDRIVRLSKKEGVEYDEDDIPDVGMFNESVWLLQGFAGENACLEFGLYPFEFQGVFFKQFM